MRRWLLAIRGCGCQLSILPLCCLCKCQLAADASAPCVLVYVASQDNRISVCFEYEYHDASGQWYRAYGNEVGFGHSQTGGSA